MKRRDLLTSALALALPGAAVALRPGAARAAQHTPLDTPLRDLNGQVRTLDHWAGYLRLVNFWATWCGPCRTEMPLFQKTYQQHHDAGLRILGVALDNPVAVYQFQEQFGISYPLLVIGTPAGQRMMARYGNRAGVIPFSVLLSPTGGLLARHVGTYSAADLAALLARHLAET